MQEIICQFAQTDTKFGLLINLQKTVSMRFNLAVQENLTVPPFNAPLQTLQCCGVIHLLYGAGTWTRKEQQTKRLECAQYRLARYMLAAKPMDHV